MTRTVLIVVLCSVFAIIHPAHSAEPTKSLTLLNSDDFPAFPAPPAGFDRKRDDIAHGKLEMIEYDSKTVGTKRKMQVYTPPGYSTENSTAEKKYPVLYLLHGIGGDETEWQRFARQPHRRWQGSPDDRRDAKRSSSKE